MSGFFAPSNALAAAIIYPASGGTNISIDTTSHTSCVGVACGTFKPLIGPSIGDDGDITTGVHTISLPAGWEFDTGSTITITPFNDIGLESTTITPGQTSFSFTVVNQSTVPGSIGFSGIKVRPMGIIPSTGDIKHSGAFIDGVIDGTTSFGTLSTIAGTVTQLVFETQPGNAIYGLPLSSQPVVKTQDQFGNDSTKDLAANLEVGLAITNGTGALVGDATLDIGTGAGNGTVTFTDLTVNEVGTKGLTASAGVLTNAVSTDFAISPKPLTATVTVDDKDYDGNNSAYDSQNITLEGVVTWDGTIDDVTTIFGGDAVYVIDGDGTHAIFASPDAGTHAISVIDVTLDGADKDNYTLADEDITGTGTINPLEITITPNTGQSKTYGDNDPVFEFTNTPDLEHNVWSGNDEFTGALRRVEGEDVGTYAYTLGDLSAGGNNGDNYTLTLASKTFEITKKDLTVAATGVNKEYDQTTAATVILSSSDEISGDNLVYDYTSASFLDKTAADGKTVNVSGISVSGAKSGNYTLLNITAATVANITQKPITVTINLNNKTYDGDTSAVYSSTNPRVAVGVISGDDVVVENTGSKSFVDEHVDVGKIVNAIGLTLSGVDADNYQFDGTGTGTATISVRPITVTAVTGVKEYDGTPVSSEEPEITTELGSDPIVPGDIDDFFQTYDTKHIGVNKTLTPDGVVHDGNPTLEGSNYDVTFVTVSTGEITQKPINVTAQSDTKIYDRTTSSDETPAVDPLEAGDTVTTQPTQAYLTADVDTGKTLTPSGLVIDDGNSGLNYDVDYVDNTNGVIEAKNLTVAGAVTTGKMYDGDVTATVDFSSAALAGVIPDEEPFVSLNPSGYLAVYDNRNAGTGKTVTVSGLALSGPGESNYSLTQPVLTNGAIGPMPLTITAVTDTKIYDGNIISGQTPIITSGAVQGDDEAAFTQSFDDPNVGPRMLQVNPGGIVNDGNGGANYTYTFETTPGSITQESLTITANDKTRPYGDANPELTASYTGFAEGEDKSVLDTPVTLTTVANETSPVGPYEITASGAADVNYNISFVSGTLTITPAPLTVIANAQSKMYGEADPAEFTYEATGFKNADNESVFTDALERDAGENVGVYAITQGSLSAGDNYTIAFTSANLTIGARPLTVSAVTDTKPYDGTTDSVGVPTYNTEELQSSDTASFTQSYNTPDVGNSKVLTVSGIVNDDNEGANYLYDFSATAVGEITPLAITIIPNSGQTKVYGTSDPIPFTYTNTPDLIGGDVFTGALSRDVGENVDTYAYNIDTLSAGGNYTLALTLTPATFSITQATPVITWANPADIVYGTALSGTELNATAGALDGEFVYTPALGTALNAGDGQTLSVTFTPTDILNYETNTATVVINVTKAPLTVTAENKTKEYLAIDPALTYTHSGLVNNDTNAVFTGALVRASGELDGTYAITQSTLLAGDNYAITFNNGTFTITDSVDPTVVSHTPSLNALNISPTTAIVVTFSEAVDVEEGDVSFSPTIYGEFAITNSGTNVVTITPNDPLEDNTTYIITLNGVEDINGNSLLAYSNIKFTTATIYSIDLNANASGWNLISLPVIPSNTAIATVLGSAINDIDAVWTYDPTDPNADPETGWLVYVPGNPSSTNNLDRMTTGFGYWVSVTGDANLSGSGTLLIAGPTLPPSRSLLAGWNLIGYYQLPNENYSFPEYAFASIGIPGVGYNGLWGFDNQSENGDFNSVDEILPGDGFWISLPSAKTYTPSNIEIYYY